MWDKCGVMMGFTFSSRYKFCVILLLIPIFFIGESFHLELFIFAITYFSPWSFLLVPLTVAFAAPTSSTVDGRAEIEERASGLFSNVDIYDPLGGHVNPGTLYARTVELPNGDLLATWENYSPEPPSVYFPIYPSANGGKSWSFLSNVVDAVNNFGLRYQPFLYVLPSAIGGFKAGTLLLAGNSIPKDLSITQIDLYTSTDSGKTWNFVSHISRGGKALPDNGQAPVWVPFLLLLNGQLICYYSDQRDPKRGQKLVHQTTTDLKKWATPVDDVAYPTYTDRPGMTTVAALPNGKWIMTYEYNGTGGFKVHSRVSSSPLTFSSGVDSKLTATDGSHFTRLTIHRLVIPRRL
jgi:hypothetical protein